MKRLVSGILAALLAVTAFSACNTNSPASSGDATSGASSTEASSGDAQKEPVTIQFWTSFTGPDGEYARDLLMIAKYYERIADHAVNIANWVLFSITGHREGV